MKITTQYLYKITGCGDVLNYYFTKHSIGHMKHFSLKNCILCNHWRLKFPGPYLFYLRVLGRDKALEWKTSY